MASFNVSVDHHTSRDAAIERLHGFADRVRDQFLDQVTDVKESWADNGDVKFSFLAMGLPIEGGMQTDDQTVSVTGTIPFAALPFKGMIEKTIAEKISEALASEG